MKFLKCGTKSKKKYYSFPKKKKPLVTLPLLQKVDEIQNHLRKYLPSSSISWRDWGKKCIQNVLIIVLFIEAALETKQMANNRKYLN